MERAPCQKAANAVAQIIDEVKRLIIDGDLCVGDRLPNEADLCKRFGKSRGSVREAIKILEYYGVLDVRQGDGTYLQASPNEGMYDAMFFCIMAKGSDLQELIEMRQIIETGILNLAIDKNDEQALRVIRNVHKDLEMMTQQSVSIDKLVSTDMAFHLALADGAGNSLLKEVYLNMLNLFFPFIYNSYIPQQENIAYSVVFQHNLILQALMERDKNLAAYAIKSAMKDWKKLNISMQAKEAAAKK